MWNNWELKRPTTCRTGPLVSCDFHLICLHHICKRDPLPHIILFRLFLSSVSFTLVACLLSDSLSLRFCICWLGLGLCARVRRCVSALFVRVSVLSLYSPLIYSATDIFPFQVLQVLLTSQTLGRCSWACRVWMGILTKGHKSEPMYSHR